MFWPRTFYRSGWLRCDVFNSIGLDVEVVDGYWCFGVIVRYSAVFLPNPSRIGVLSWWMVVYVLSWCWRVVLYIIYYILYILYIILYIYYYLILYSSSVLHLSPIFLFSSPSSFILYLSVLTYTYLYSFISFQYSLPSPLQSSSSLPRLIPSFILSLG